MADRSFSQDLSVGALSTSYEFWEDTKINHVLIKFDRNVTEDVTVTLDSKFGEDYDILLDSVSLINQGSYVWFPESPIIISVGDKVLIECTNANNIGSLYGSLNMGVKSGQFVI